MPLDTTESPAIMTPNAFTFRSDTVLQSRMCSNWAPALCPEVNKTKTATICAYNLMGCSPKCLMQTWTKQLSVNLRQERAEPSPTAQCRQDAGNACHWDMSTTYTTATPENTVATDAITGGVNVLFNQNISTRQTKGIISNLAIW